MAQHLGSYKIPDNEELLAQSGSVRSSASYSDESFESLTDESSWEDESDLFNSVTNESVPNYESDSFESFSSKANSSPISYSETNSVAPEASKDTLDRNISERYLIEKWIRILGEQKSQRVASARPQPEVTEIESPALQAFCSSKMHLLRQQSRASKQDKQPPGSHKRNSNRSKPSCHVPPELLNRLQLQNMKETINQLLQAEIHEPLSCPNCSQKQAEMAQSQFVKLRKSKLESILLQAKLEEFTYTKDVVSRFGEIHQSLPKPSDGSSAIWQRLCASVNT